MGMFFHQRSCSFISTCSHIVGTSYYHDTTSNEGEQLAFRNYTNDEEIKLFFMQVSQYFTTYGAAYNKLKAL